MQVPGLQDGFMSGSKPGALVSASVPQTQASCPASVQSVSSSHLGRSAAIAQVTIQLLTWVLEIMVSEGQIKVARPLRQARFTTS